MATENVNVTPSVPSVPRIGDEAPDFVAVTTQGEIGFRKWQGSDWSILFSHPADFTPVCSTELVELARRHDEFAAMNAKLIGLSVDSIHSHLAWRENLREKMDATIPFPMIADSDGRVARLYGMLHPGESSTVTVRAVFMIDPSHVVRALIYYPLNVGRNVEEMKRLLTALQTTDAHSVATAVNWTEGEKVVVPPPKTEADVAERNANDTYDRVDFYLNLRDL